MELNKVMEFGTVVEISEGGKVTIKDDLYAPEFVMIQEPVSGSQTDIWMDDDGWSPIIGYSGQQDYAGPIMHPSEYIGGGMERDLLKTPGIYVAVIVFDFDLEEPVGWAVLERED